MRTYVYRRPADNPRSRRWQPPRFGGFVGLRYHWKLQDSAASTVVIEEIEGDDGTLVGGDNTADIDAAGPGTLLTSSLDLDGSADYIDISAAGVSFAGTDEWSAMAWVNPDAVSTETIFGKIGANTPSIRIGTGTTIIVQLGGTSVTFTVPTISTAGVWIHVAITHAANGDTRVYIDNVESSTGVQTNTGAFGPDTIGLRNATSFFDGEIADARIYNYVITDFAPIMAEKDIPGGSTLAAQYYYQHFLGAAC